MTRFAFACGALSALAAFTFARPSDACSTACDDAAGEVGLPPTANLSLPFADGEAVLVTSGYGPSGGSTGHCYSQDTLCGNDYFALDLVLTGHPSGGQGEPVLAAADGTVIDAGWSSEGWASYGQRVYVAHDFGDGHEYTTVYAHLDSIAVQKGDVVQKGTKLGALGHSSMGIVENPNMGSHLHFSIHRDAKYGGSGTGGSYAGNAVRPEPLDGQSGFAKGKSLVSKIGSPVTPPPACDVVIAATGFTTIEDTSSCVDKLGTLSESTSGLGGHAFTAVLDNPDPDYAEGAFWNLAFEKAGSYDVYAFVPSGISNLTSAAVYKTRHGGKDDFVTLDQAAHAGDWVLLGSHDFAAAGPEWVRLGDNFANPSVQGKTFVIDALRLGPAGSPPPASGGSAGIGGGGGAGGSGGIVASGGAAGAAAAASGAPEPAGDDLGCACRLGRERSSSVLALVFSAALGLSYRRRHGRACSRTCSVEAG